MLTSDRDRLPLLLLIEDDRDTLVAAGRLLQSCGFDLEIGRGGEDGFEKAVHRHPDVIVTDVVMPGTSGFDVCERLHSTPQTRDIPVIVYTGLTEVHALAGLVGFGVGVFAIKPCLPTVVANEARTLLQEPRSTPASIRVVTGEGELLEDLARSIDACSASVPQ